MTDYDESLTPIHSKALYRLAYSVIAQKSRLKFFSALFALFHQKVGIVWKDWSNEKRVMPYLASNTGQQLQIPVKKKPR